MKIIYIVGIILLATALVVGAILFYKNTSTEQFIQTCHYTTDNGPDPLCTPGDKGAIDLKVLCAPAKYDSKPTKAIINEVYARYGINESDRSDFAIDNLVPLELGGSQDIKNLWPQSIYFKPGFDEKNIAEKRLHDLVCSNRMPLASAQYLIIHNWKTNAGLWN